MKFTLLEPWVPGGLEAWALGNPGAWGRGQYQVAPTGANLWPHLGPWGLARSTHPNIQLITPPRGTPRVPHGVTPGYPPGYIGHTH